MTGWVPEHLVPFVRSFVGYELNRPVSIFFDRDGIAVGDTWALKLRKALVHSRCLMTIWTPLYFHSEWCRRECAIMLYRETRLGLRTAAQPEGLVVPLNVFDGQHFPPRAKTIQWFDLRDYWIAGPAFPASSQYVNFQQQLRTLAPQVAGAIRRAPPWQARWQKVTWYDVDVSDLQPPSADNFDFPGIE
jgi:TIR domain-containing protein